MTKTIISILIILLLTEYSFAQSSSDFEENWLRPVAGSYCTSLQLQFEYNSFSRSDTIAAKAKFDYINKSSPKNEWGEWEGNYYTNTEIGDDMLYWSKTAGFLKFYCYHTVRRLDYGDVKSTGNAVFFSSSKPPENEPNNQDTFRETLIQVKFGKRHFLVPEKRIETFAELMAGLRPRNDVNEHRGYWAKESDKKDAKDVRAKLPGKYKHFLRDTIEARIVSIGNRHVLYDVQTYLKRPPTSVIYTVILNKGSKAGIKVGMDFFVDDLNQWLNITSVANRRSIAIFERDIWSDRTEKCRDNRNGQGQLTPCLKVRTGMKVRTVPQV